MRFIHRSLFVVLGIILMVSCSASPLEVAAEKAIEGDVRNSGIDLEVKYDSAQRIVFNIEAMDGEKSPQDVFRLLLQFAAVVHEMNIESRDTLLSSLGESRFIIPASHFSLIGEEYGTQNPMYTLRTFPANLKTLDGDPAYENHQGGLLYLMRVQMDDFNDFMSKWIVEPMSGAIESNSKMKKPDEFLDDDAFG